MNDIAEKPLTTNPKINLIHKTDIINRIAKGEPQRSIAKDYDIGQAAVSNIKKANQQTINQQQAELISLLPTATEIVKDELEANILLTKRIRIDPYNVDPFKIALKSELNKTLRDLWKISGIYPSHNTLINTGKITVNQQINPTLTKFIGDSALQQLSKAINTDLVDTTAVTTDSDSPGNVDNS
ncbi:hypothetical protein LCGC14_1268780 [marine sediment metagenome]|uniref:Uncharacterized protein n=1 Tax=marine sediment metagenome TaxID=412755 RepID=A0A0F9L0K2_9ZZZZ